MSVTRSSLRFSLHLGRRKLAREPPRARRGGGTRKDTRFDPIPLAITLASNRRDDRR